MKIIDIAKTYIGQFEVSGNKGFKDPIFQSKMIEDGFTPGDSWCALFQELLFKEAYLEHYNTFDKLFHKSCTQTLRNFKAAGYGISMYPRLGSLMIMRKYIDNEAQWQGHAGLVSKVINEREWLSIEGNTSSGAKNAEGIREGDSVQENHHVEASPKTGLRVAGFVLIHETLCVLKNPNL